jgi:hypothetical protein
MKPVAGPRADVAIESHAREDFPETQSRDARRLGSLFGNIDYLVEQIANARDIRAVKVWLDVKCEVICAHSDADFETSASHLIGTYDRQSPTARIRADIADWQIRRADRDVRHLAIRWFVDRDPT